MSPERIKNASRNAANDIWSIGAIFVQMITGQTINHQDTQANFFINVSQYKIFINEMPYNKFLQTISEIDLQKKIISQTICLEAERASCQELLSMFPADNANGVMRVMQLSDNAGDLRDVDRAPHDTPVFST